MGEAVDVWGDAVLKSLGVIPFVIRVGPGQPYDRTWESLRSQSQQVEQPVVSIVVDSGGWV